LFFTTLDDNAILTMARNPKPKQVRASRAGLPVLFQLGILAIGEALALVGLSSPPVSKALAAVEIGLSAKLV
jgi:hypothetical protein